MTKLQKTFNKIADRLRELGTEYYDKGDRTATAVFWELESVYRKLAQNEIEVKEQNQQ